MCKVISMVQKKLCACGKAVILNKGEAAENEIGWWQDCECGSTLLFQKPDSEEKEDFYKRNMRANKRAKERRDIKRHQDNEKVKKQYNLKGGGQ